MTAFCIYTRTTLICSRHSQFLPHALGCILGETAQNIQYEITSIVIFIVIVVLEVVVIIITIIVIVVIESIK